MLSPWMLPKQKVVCVCARHLTTGALFCPHPSGSDLAEDPASLHGAHHCVLSRILAWRQNILDILCRALILMCLLWPP